MSNTPKQPPIAVTPQQAKAFGVDIPETILTAKPTISQSAQIFAQARAAQDGKPIPNLVPQPRKITPTGSQPFSVVPANAPTAAAFAAAQKSKNTQTTNSADFAPSLQVDGLDPASVEAVLAGLRDLSSFQPNALQGVDNMTYHFRLFQTPDRDVIRVNIGEGITAPSSVTEYYSMLDKFEQVTIAETGTTGYNITSVQNEALVAPNFRSAAINTTSIVLNITEPNGVSFLDSLKNAAVSMKVRDYRKCWYYLELTFKGYEDGALESNALGGENLANGGRWIWIVQITNIETKLTAGGGQYKLSMVPYSDTAFDQEARSIPDMMFCEGDTIDEFFTSLKEQLNEAWHLRQASPSYLAFDFVFHGIKGRKSVTADTVKNFSLKSPDTAYFDSLRHQALNDKLAADSASGTISQTAPTDPVNNTVTVSKSIPPTGSRASSAKLAALVKEIIPNAVVTSGQRTAAHNAAVGGKANSQHVDGTAIDIETPAMSKAQLKAEFAKRGVQVDVIDHLDFAGEKPHYHIQGARATTRRGSVDSNLTPEQAKEAASTVGAPPVQSDTPIQIDPLSGKPRGQFNRGTSIDEIVKTVFSCCEAAQVLIKDSDKDPYSADDVSDSSSDRKVNDKGFRESLLFRVEPEIRVLLYDPLFNKYGKFIIYHIYGYVTQSPILSRTQIIQANDVDVQKKMLANLAKQGLLRKRYDYLYSGMNTEIIDFDISFDLMWAATLPRMLRNEAFTAQTRYDPKKVNQVTDALTNQVNAYQDRALALETFNELSSDPNANADKLKQAQLDVTTSDASLSDANNKLAALRAELLKTLPTISSGEALSGKRTYAETLDVASLPAINYEAIALEYGQDAGKNSLNGGMVGQFHNGRTIFGTVMNQLEGPLNASMVSITMKIIGDPYWIGPANMEQTVLRFKEETSERLADYTIGDNTFILDFSYPLGTGDDDQVKLNKSEIFTGVYRVVKVTHDFADGRFTQNIEALRLPLIDLFKATLTTQSA